MKKLIYGLLVIIAVCSFTSPALAEDNNLCAVDADVVLALDVSGSMNDFTPSKCNWQNLESVSGSYYCVNHSQDGLTEQECLAKPNPDQCHFPVYTKAIPVKIDSAKDAAKSFIDNFKTADQSALVTFADTASLVKSLSSDHIATEAAIDGVIVGGATDIGDAIGKAITELSSTSSNPQATKTIILLTDGKANKPNGNGYDENALDVAYAQQKATEAANLGYKIFTIGLGSGSEINETMLQEIAAITGAQYHHAPDGTWLNGIYQAISSEMCQYGSISGCKYKDLNNNGIIDPTDTPLADWQIILSGKASATQMTDQNGCYTFAGLLAGNYIVSEGENDSQKPYTQTFPGDIYSIALATAENATAKDFANYFPPPAECVSGAQQSCSTGQQGICSAGTKTCSTSGFWGECVAPTPSTEICADGLDNDCDGDIDDCAKTISPGDILITEIMQNPKAVSDTYGEWFELYNKTGSAIDLLNCTITDGAGGGDNHVFSSFSIPATSYVVLAKNGNPLLNGGITPNYVYSGIFLSNLSDKIILNCDGVVINKVEYDGGVTFPNPNGASMILKDINLDNNVGSNWCVSTSSYGLGDKGTPGALNDVCGATTCASGAQQSCSTGLLEVCSAGTQLCSALGEWGQCTQTTTSSAEICADGLDNDCDGQIDSNDSDCIIPPAVCTVGEQRACTTSQQGVCSSGNQTCSAGGIWGECVATAPATEICDDGLDNDCDGNIDANDSDCAVPTTCTALEQTSCATGQQGICSSGIKTCSAEGIWGECVAQSAPVSEICDDGLDNNCDGQVDNCGGTTTCTSGAQQSCTTGLLGVCTAGTQTCSDLGEWGQCTQTTTSSAEICTDGLDNDCDGQVDNCGGTTACTSGAERSCVTGQQGVCSNGNQTCSTEGEWGECIRQTAPSDEICTDSIDNDCDGTSDVSDSDCQNAQPRCGDGIVNIGETCDNGAQNGEVCETSCGSSCSYCSESCSLTTLQNAPCSDGGIGIYYYLSVSKTGSGSGLVKSLTGNINCGNSCSDSYSHGSTITLTVTPDENSTFSGWNGACSGASSTCTLMLDKDKSVTAEFTSKDNISTAASGGGTEICSPYLLEYIKYGAKNNPEEVKKLQTFLNEYMGANLPVTGYYDLSTMEWVNKFQLKFTKEVLKPWEDAGFDNNPELPTGYVYKTTKRWINMIKCMQLNLPIPDFSEDRKRLLGE